MALLEDILFYELDSKRGREGLHQISNLSGLAGREIQTFMMTTWEVNKRTIIDSFHLRM